MNSEKETYIYRVDPDDIIVSVSDNWSAFAEHNCGGDALRAENIVGTSLWDGIHGSETIHLYSIILEKTRERLCTPTFPFRCDSPRLRRYFTLALIPEKNGAIEFQSRLERIEQRDPVRIMEPETNRSKELIRICSMCRKMALSDDKWEEVETALQELKYFEEDPLPMISHGFCPSCYDAAMAEIDQME